MGEKMKIGEFIAIRRNYLRMTQEELAEQLHVSKSAIAKWETNRGIPDRDNINNIARVLKVSIDDLYRIIVSEDLEEADICVNITEEVIKLLESYGYTVIPPNRGVVHEAKLSSYEKKFYRISEIRSDEE